MVAAVRRLRRLSLVASVPLLCGSYRPDLYLIPLHGTGVGSRLTGLATLAPARSPFGLATTRDGHFVFEIAVDVPVLPPPTTFSPSATGYVAWVTTANLDRVERIGPVVAGTAVRGKVAMAKFLVVITAESSTGGAKWTGPIVMRGTSASSYLTNFSGHTMFNGGVPQ